MALMAGIALIVAIPVTLILRDDDEGSGPKHVEIPDAPPPKVGDPEYLRDIGVELRVPKGWELKEDAGVVQLRSGDTRALVAISAPGTAEEAAQIGEEAIASLRDEYRDVHVVQDIKGKKLGGAKSITVAVSARRPNDDAELRILVSVAVGEDRAYLVEVFAAPPGAEQALTEAQALLNNLKLEG